MEIMNINNREKSLILYKELMEKSMWEAICKQANRNADTYEWLRINFDSNDIDDSEEDLYKKENLYEKETNNMTVKTAKEHIKQINEVLNKIVMFDKSHKELSKEAGFLVDAVAFLCDYRNVLNNAIDKAELKL